MPLQASRVLKTFKYAMYFDGVDDYVVNTGFNWSVLQNGYTIAIWLNTADKSSDIIRHYSTPRGYYYLAYTSEYTRIGVVSRSTDTNEYIEINQKSNSNPPNMFNHAVFTWNTTQGCWYANGVLDRCISDTRTGKGMAYTGFYIGKPYGTDWYQGYIEQLLIYSRVLSDSEVQWNYLYRDNPVRNGLVLWLQADPNNVKDIDNDGILEWIDLSGYNNHGKIYGGASLVQLVKPAIRILPKARLNNILR